MCDYSSFSFIDKFPSARGAGGDAGPQPQPRAQAQPQPQAPSPGPFPSPGPDGGGGGVGVGQAAGGGRRAAPLSGPCSGITGGHFSNKAAKVNCFFSE